MESSDVEPVFNYQGNPGKLKFNAQPLRRFQEMSEDLYQFGSQVLLREQEAVYAEGFIQRTSKSHSLIATLLCRETYRAQPISTLIASLLVTVSAIVSSDRQIWIRTSTENSSVA